MGHLSHRVKALLEKHGNDMTQKQREHAEWALKTRDPVHLEAAIINAWHLTHMRLPPDSDDDPKPTQLKLKMD